MVLLILVKYLFNQKWFLNFLLEILYRLYCYLSKLLHIFLIFRLCPKVLLINNSSGDRSMSNSLILFHSGCVLWFEGTKNQLFVAVTSTDPQPTDSPKIRQKVENPKRWKIWSFILCISSEIYPSKWFFYEILVKSFKNR